MNDTNRKPYYGYGILSNSFFVERLFGRPLQTNEQDVVLEGFSLNLVDRNELPQSVQDDTPKGFQIYGLVDDPKGRVKALLLELSPEEEKLIEVLDFEGILYQSRETVIPQDGRMATVEVLRDQSLGTRVVDQLEYHPFLRGWETAAALADEVRGKVLLGTTQKGIPSHGKER